LPKDRANYYFGATAITSPILGAVLSGLVTQKFENGYGSPKILPFALILAFCGFSAAVFVPFVNTPLLCVGLIWVVLFCGAFVLPICTGVWLGKVEAEMRPRANSIANLCYNLFGFFPAPILYGFANTVEGSKNSRWGMALLMYSVALMIIFVVLAIIYDENVCYRDELFG